MENIHRHIREESKATEFIYTIECFGPDKKLKWTEEVHNIVTTQGKNDNLSQYLKGAAYTAAFFLLLKGAGSVAVGDTLASHSGWTEITPYAGNRPAITWGSVSAGSVASSPVVISITAAGPTTISGAGVCTVASGTSGVLYSVSDFSVNRVTGAGDTLNVTVTEALT